MTTTIKREAIPFPACQKCHLQAGGFLVGNTGEPVEWDGTLAVRGDSRPHDDEIWVMLCLECLTEVMAAM